MANEHYDSEDAKDALRQFTGEMIESWKDFLTGKETVSAILREIRENETEKSYTAIVNEIGFSREDADVMIAAYQEEITDGQKEKHHCA